MNKKKIFSMLLTFSLIASSITPAAALSNSDLPLAKEASNPTVISAPVDNLELSKEDALKKSKEILQKYFSIVINDKDFKYNISLDTYNYEGSQVGKRSWSIQWYQKSYNKDINIYTSIDATTGNLIYMNKSDYKTNGNFSVPTLSIEEAQKIAEDIIKKINPEEFKNVVPSNNKWFANRGNSSNYNFNYVRNINGATYANNNIYVNIDGTNGQVTSYNCNWSYDLAIPKKETYISSILAQSIFKNDMNVTLKYKLFSNKYEYQNAENKKNVKLVYEPTFKNGYTLDAKTGKFTSLDVVNNAPLDSANLTPKELEDLYSKYVKIEESKTPIAESKALSIATESVKKLYGEGYTINDLRYSENINKTWTAFFNKKINERFYENGSISINALNGQILYISNYSPYDYNEKFTPKFTWKEGYYKAIDLLGTYYKDKVKDLELSLTHEEAKYYEVGTERFYRYSFVRKANNIPFENNGIYIEFNVETGAISYMSSNWENDITFPDPTKSIESTMAKEALISKYKPSLNYIIVNTSSDPKNYVPGLKLVYSLEYTPVSINAIDGKILNSYDGEEVKFDITEFLNEIKGSIAEKEIKILAYKGLIDTNNFKLNAEVKKIDLIKTLVDALGYTPYVVNDMAYGSMENTATKEASVVSNQSMLTDEDYIKMAIYYGILVEYVEKLDLKATVTKEEMSKALIRFLQYDKIAQHSEIFTLNFKDANTISKENTGYIALARGLNLVSLDKNNNFNPKSVVTKEELALSLFKTLQNKETNNYNIYPIYK